MKKSFSFSPLFFLLCFFNSLIDIQAYGAPAIGKKTMQDAPYTWIGSANPCQPAQLSFQVFDTNFTNITSISLRLDYNPNCMVYDTFSNVNSQLSGLLVNDNHVSDTLHKLIIVWTDINPKSIPNGQALLTLVFDFAGGSTSLTWNNTANGGSDCEYGDANGNPMNDLPTESYYHNGYVEDGAVGASGNVNGNAEVCQGDEAGIYSVDPILNATHYIWTIPPGSDITSGAGTNQIYLHFSSSAASGDVQVYGESEYCTGTPSAPLYVTVNNQPSPPVIISSGDCLLSDYTLGNQWYDSTGIITGATGMQYCPVKTGYYSAKATVNGCTSPPSNWVYFFVTGILNPDLFEVDVFPNPVVKTLTVNYNLSDNALIVITITNLLGQSVMHITSLQESGKHQQNIDVQGIDPGIYNLKIQFKCSRNYSMLSRKIVISQHY